MAFRSVHVCGNLVSTGTGILLFAWNFTPMKRFMSSPTRLGPEEKRKKEKGVPHEDVLGIEQLPLIQLGMLTSTTPKPDRTFRFYQNTTTGIYRYFYSAVLRDASRSDTCLRIRRVIQIVVCYPYPNIVKVARRTFGQMQEHCRRHTGASERATFGTVLEQQIATSISSHSKVTIPHCCRTPGKCGSASLLCKHGEGVSR